MSDSVGKAADRFRAAGIESARADARLLWEHARHNEVAFKELVLRRLEYEPVAYIRGHKEFWSLDFEVGPGALVPRPETETLIEAALAELPDQNAAIHVLDLGTGSGCLLVALLSEYPNAVGVGVDSSGAALEWARRNVLRHGMSDRVRLMPDSWENVKGTFDLIVSNPPYVPTGDVAALMPDVRDYEPPEALDGGPGGLDAYRSIAQVLKGHLKPEGLALLEIGAGQLPAVSGVMMAAGLQVVRFAADLAGIPRCAVIRVP